MQNAAQFLLLECNSIIIFYIVMIVSALASPSYYESHLHPSKNLTVKSFFGETITATSLISQIEEVRTVVMNYCIYHCLRHLTI
jgi:hypothetical protein